MEDEKTGAVIAPVVLKKELLTALSKSTDNEWEFEEWEDGTLKIWLFDWLHTNLNHLTGIDHFNTEEPTTITWAIIAILNKVYKDALNKNKSLSKDLKEAIVEAIANWSADIPELKPIKASPDLKQSKNGVVIRASKVEAVLKECISDLNEDDFVVDLDNRNIVRFYQNEWLNKCLEGFVGQITTDVIAILKRVYKGIEKNRNLNQKYKAVFIRAIESL